MAVLGRAGDGIEIVDVLPHQGEYLVQGSCGSVLHRLLGGGFGALGRLRICGRFGILDRFGICNRLRICGRLVYGRLRRLGGRRRGGILGFLLFRSSLRRALFGCGLLLGLRGLRLFHRGGGFLGTLHGFYVRRIRHFGLHLGGAACREAKRKSHGAEHDKMFFHCFFLFSSVPAFTQLGS